jgi:hypothetical protein
VSFAMRMIKNRCKALSNLGRAFDEHITVFWFESIYDEVMELLELEGVTAAWKEGVRTILLGLPTVLSSPRLARAVSACSQVSTTTSRATTLGSNGPPNIGKPPPRAASTSTCSTTSGK